MSTVAITNTTARISGYVVKEAMKGFMNDRLFSGLVRSDYKNEFEEEGAKKGDSIEVRRPAQFRVRDGAGMEIQDVHEDKVKVTLPEQKGVDFQFSVRELTLNIEKNSSDYSKRFVRPAGSALASDFDAAGLAVAAKSAGSTIVLGSGSTNDQIYEGFLKAKALLNKFLAPKRINERNAVVNSDIEIKLAQNVKQLYNNAAAITKAIKEGTIQDVAGLTWASTDLSYVHTNGAGGDTLTVGSITPDYDNMTQWIPVYSGSHTLAVGDTIQFNASYFVNPETKALYPNNLQRKVLATRGSGSGLECLVYSIRPVLAANSVTDAESRKKYAMANCSSTPASGNTATCLGTAGKNYVCCPVFHRDAIVMTTVDLARPTKVEMVNSVNYKNVVLRFVKDYDVQNDRFPNRLDMLGVFTAILPEWLVSVEYQID